MRGSLLLVTILTLFIITSSTQKNQIEGDAIPLSKVDRLYYTCKIWGFLKYYHPMVGKGSYDWDEKLQGVLKNTASIETTDAFSTYFSRWIYYMGQVPECPNCNQKREYKPFLKNFDLSWIQDPVFSNELKKHLKNVENNRYQGDHHYVAKGELQQFEPKNESRDYEFSVKDENNRLLPLFRYWNYIEYFYPYKYQTDQHWDDVLKDMIPKFLAVKTKLDLHLAMLELVVKLDDNYASLNTTVLEELPYYNFLPAKIELIEDQAVVTEIIDVEKARLNDLQVGDIIKSINGQSIGDIHNSNKKYIWGSNDAVKDRSLYQTLFMGIQEAPSLTIERGNVVRTDNVTLFKSSELSYESTKTDVKWETLDDSIGYVNMGKVEVGEVDQMMKELMENAVIIFDVRNNPKGTYAAIAKYLNPKDTTFAIFTKPDFSYPGKFVWQGESSCGQENADYYKGKVILLVNETTQNHAEFTCMCLQTAPDAVVIGSQTAGSNGVVTRFPILSRWYTYMTGFGIFYPDGTETARVGIIPDIYVKPTVAGVRAGRDEVLEKAIEVGKEEVARLIEKARQEELARLREMERKEEIARLMMAMDSLGMDTLRFESSTLDSLQIDSIRFVVDSLRIETTPIDSLGNEGN